MQQVQSPRWTSELVPQKICFFFSFLEAQSAVGLASHGNNLYYTRSGMLPRFARAILSRECGAPTRFLPSVVPVTAANVFSVVTLGDCIVKFLFSPILRLLLPLRKIQRLLMLLLPLRQRPPCRHTR